MYSDVRRVPLHRCNYRSSRVAQVLGFFAHFKSREFPVTNAHCPRVNCFAIYQHSRFPSKCSEEMDGIVRRLKINELRARILLYKLEDAALLRELRSSNTSTGRRAEIYRRQPRLEFEYLEAVNDLEWLEAEERLGRPIRVRSRWHFSPLNPVLSQYPVSVR